MTLWKTWQPALRKGRTASTLLASFALLVSVMALPAQASDQNLDKLAGLSQDKLTVTLLGTTTPTPRPTRFSNSTLVQAAGLNLVFDAGRGAAIRLTQLGIGLGDIDGVFITHFHSDHLVGLDDIWMTGYIPAVGNRTEPLELYGPPGTKQIADGLMTAFKADTDIRKADENVSEQGALIDAHEQDEDGVIFEKDGVKVTMFTVNHGKLIKPSVGYRIDYNGHSVLISGDTKYNENVIKYGQGVDVLIHEIAAAPDGLLEAQPKFKAVMNHHIMPRQAGKIFTRTQPKLAVYTHIVRLQGKDFAPVTFQEISDQTRETYDGPLLIGEDLTRIVIGDAVTVMPIYSGW